MRWRFFIAEALRSIRGNAATTLAAVVTVLIVTFLLGVNISIGWWIYNYTNNVRGDVTLKLYLPGQAATSPALRNRVANQVERLPFVKSWQYVSPQEAVKQLPRKQQAELDVLKSNPLPPAFYLKLTDPDRVADVARSAGQIGPVRNCGQPPCITYGKKTTDRVLQVTKDILYFVVGLMVLLGIAAVILIANTIRLSIFARRREIEVMKLVGATNSFVRMPFVVEGMLTGVFGALFAVGLLSVVYSALSRINHGLTDPARSVGIGLLIAILSGFGLVLGACGSALTLRRFLRV